jgi:hypothetical protein
MSENLDLDDQFEALGAPRRTGRVSMGRAGIEPATLGLRGPCSAG